MKAVDLKAINQLELVEKEKPVPKKRGGIDSCHGLRYLWIGYSTGLRYGFLSFSDCIGS